MKKLGLFIATILLSVFLIAVLTSTNKKGESKGTYSTQKVYTFLSDEKNRRQVYETSIELNKGTSANSCAYFIAEVLRKNGIQVSKDVCNTSQIITCLKKNGWMEYRNYKDLKPGDICFTTDAFGNKDGTPSHTYVFMKWIKENNYEYAYICDNQAKDYKNNVYHIRNITVKATANGFSKDKFSFFMRDDK